MSERAATLHDLLAGATPPGVYRLPARASLRTVQRMAAQHGWRVYRIMGRRIADKPTFLAESARSLHFPKYFGHNWDAFEESLNDLAYDAAGRTLVLFDHAGRLAAAEPEEFAVALDILRAAVEARRASDFPLVVILQGAARATDATLLRMED
ncbi:MAG: Barstar (barnase inhibitor) [Chloroflexi bacterium ADurb.Bin325]|nr:MAG: Barstar (barnase inhibitor) [Chloroflexi bacterium ADurb.Bin325]